MEIELKFKKKVLFKILTVVAVLALGVFRFYIKNAVAKNSSRNSFKEAYVDKGHDKSDLLRACDKRAHEFLKVIKADNGSNLLKGYKLVGDELIHLVSLTEKGDCFFLMGSDSENELRPWVVSFDGEESPAFVYEYKSLSNLHSVNEGLRGFIKFERN